MISYRPLGQLSEPSIERRPFTARLAEFDAVPLADTELMAASHHFPIAVRMDDAGPSVVALLRYDFVARKFDDNPATWASKYVPVALRFFPFRLVEAVEIPAQALEVAEDVAGDGYRQAIELVEKDGAPSKLVKTAHASLMRVHASQPKLADIANQLVLCEALTPLLTTSSPSAPAEYYTVDMQRLRQMRFSTCAALARRTFLPVDLVATLAFSQRHIRQDAIDAGTQMHEELPDDGATQVGAPWLVPWLDMSGLFPANIAGAFTADDQQSDPASG